jgi:hypothetical protein
MNFRRRRLASVLGLEVCDSLFDLTAPLRIFFALCSFSLSGRFLAFFSFGYDEHAQ